VGQKFSKKWVNFQSKNSSVLDQSLQQQLDTAIESKDISELEILHESSYMNVRRAVARNRNINSEIANTLARDPVVNVAYMALKNPNCTITREFSHEEMCECVRCEKDERMLECTECENKRVFR
jgi:hypothetical protein